VQYNLISTPFNPNPAGVPLTCPSKCLSSHDSSKLESETSQRIEKVVEEFRRYKVKNEIWRKHKVRFSGLRLAVPRLQAVQRFDCSTLCVCHTCMGWRIAFVCVTMKGVHTYLTHTIFFTHCMRIWPSLFARAGRTRRRGN
jgi:hypothetical protein